MAGEILKPTVGSGPGQAVLARGVRLPVIAAILCRYGVSGMIVVAVPLIVAVFERQILFAAALGVSFLICLGALALRKRFHLGSDISRLEALVSASLVFAISALLFSIPFMQLGMSFTDAVFEAMSGITTTGLSMVEAPEELPFSAILARAWLQWCGGAVIVFSALALVITPGAIARRLGAPSFADSDILASTRTRARQVLAIYVALTLLCFAALAVTMGNIPSALVHSLATVSTGGFSAHSDSLAGYSALPVGVAMGFSFLGALSIASFAGLWRRDLRQPFLSWEPWFLIALIAIVTFAIAAAETNRSGEASWPLFYAAASTAASAQTTVGFSVSDVSELTDFSKVVLVISMMVGGDAGSTAGGIKLLRLLLILKAVHVVLLRVALPPNAVSRVRLRGRGVAEDELLAVFGLIVLFVAVQFAGWLAFVAAGYAPLDSLFDVTSALGTVGLSTGIVSPELPDFHKWVLIVLMWLGRVELIGVLILLLPRTWLTRG